MIFIWLKHVVNCGNVRWVSPCFSPIVVILMVEPCSNHGLQGLENEWILMRSMTDQPSSPPCLYIGIAEISKWVCLETGPFDHFFEKRAINTSTIQTMTFLNHWNGGALGLCIWTIPKYISCSNVNTVSETRSWKVCDIFFRPGLGLGLKNVSRDFYSGWITFQIAGFMVGIRGRSVKCIAPVGSSCVPATVPNLCLSFCQSRACLELNWISIRVKKDGSCLSSLGWQEKIQTMYLRRRAANLTSCMDHWAISELTASKSQRGFLENRSFSMGWAIISFSTNLKKAWASLKSSSI